MRVHSAAWILLPLVLLATTLHASAPAKGNVEVSIFGGASLLDAHRETRAPVPIPVDFPIEPAEFRTGTSLGGSAQVGFRISYFVSRRAALEVGQAVDPSHGLANEFSFECGRRGPCPFLPRRPTHDKVSAYHYDVGLLYELVAGGVRPFLTLGLGGASYGARDRTDTSLAAIAGAGLKLDLGRVAARLELSDHVLFDLFLTRRTENDPQLRAGLSFRRP